MSKVRKSNSRRIGNHQSISTRRHGVSPGPIDIIDDCIRAHRITKDEAISQLSKSGQPLSLLFAGELAIEQAVSCQDRDRANGYLNMAGVMLDRCASPVRLGSSTQARARIQKAMLPFRAWIIEGKLPPDKVSNIVYGKTIEEAHRLARAYKEQPVLEGSRKVTDAIGFMAELSVWCLLSRFSQREGVGSDTFTPTLSTLSDDRKNTWRSAVNHSWDVGVFTEGAMGIPELTYRVQVKAGSSGIDKQRCGGDEEGITTVWVGRDLAMEPSEVNAYSEIIFEAFDEVRGVDSQNRVSDRLDRRTEKLLDILG